MLAQILVDASCCAGVTPESHRAALETMKMCQIEVQNDRRVRNGRRAEPMKIIKQVGIIFFVCWISQILETALPFDFPASVIGMLLLLALLFQAR